MLAEALLEWLHEGRILAGQLTTATADSSTAWVGVYPLDADGPEAREVLSREGVAVLPGANIRAYRIRLFEIAESLRESNFGEEDMTSKQSVVVFGDEALLAKLAELDVPLDILDSPRRVDYPM